MMTTMATVVEVSPLSNGFHAKLSCEQQTSCQGCSAIKSCAAGITTKALANKSHFWELNSSVALKVGEMVEIGLPEKAFLKTAMLVYLLPLLMMFLGGSLGAIFKLSEPLVICLFVSAGAIGFWLTKIFAHRLTEKAQTSVVLIRRFGQSI